MRDKSIIKRYKFSLPMVLLSGLLFAFLAWKMDASAGPDESMRYLVVDWIIKHNALPTGYEEEIINPMWGFSYAFTPYLPSMIGAIFAKIASVFTDDPRVLLFACRLVNVFAGMGTVFVSFRVGDKLLDNRKSVYFMASIVAFLPQFVFLSGYLNNDVMTLLTGFMILDAILDGAGDKWSVKSMIYLAFGVGICALTYYFGYGWIIFAIAGFIYTSLKQDIRGKALWRRFGIVFLMVFILAGWYFIRNGIIYHGDFLGYRQQLICTEQYMSKYGLYPVYNPGRLSMHLRDMLHNGRWTETTWESFIGMFGGMIICLDGKFYDFYMLAAISCTVMFLLFRHKTKDKISTPFLMSLLFEIVFPIVLSIYNSYTRDYQPQGRYVIALLPAAVVIFAVGMDEFSKAVKAKYSDSRPALARFGYDIPMWSAVLLFLVFAVIFYTVMLPTLTFTVLPGADKVSFYYVR